MKHYLLLVLAFVTLVVMGIGCTETVLTNSGSDGDVESEGGMLVDGDVESDIDLIDGDTESETDTLACEANARWCEDTFLHVCNEAGTDEFIPEDCGTIGCDDGLCVVEHAVSLGADYQGRIVIADSESLRVATPHLTLEGWIKDWSDLGLTNMFSKGYYNDRSVNYAFGIGVKNEEFSIYLTFSSDGETYAWNAYPENVPATDTWLHAAAVLDSNSGEARFYINGKRLTRVEGPAEYPESIVLPTHNPAAITARYTRKIDELRLSDIPRYFEDFTPELRHAMDDHTLGLWHFDEGEGFAAVDSSGNGNNGTLDESGVSFTDNAIWRNWECVPLWGQCLTDSTERKVCQEDGLGWNEPTECGPIGCEDRDCVEEYALAFDGRVDLPVSDKFLIYEQDQSTLEAWVKFDDVSTWQRIYSEANETDDIDGEPIETIILLQLFMDGNGRLAFGQKTDSQSLVYSEENIISAGVWYHVAATRSKIGVNAEYKIYLNGEEVISQVVVEYEAEWYLAESCQIAGKWNDFYGTIDELRISNTIRYSESFTPTLRHEKDEHTVGLWHFNEDTGAKAVDSSGNGHHGQIPISCVL